MTQDGRLEGSITLTEIKGVPRARWPFTTVAEAMLPLSKVRRVSPDEAAPHVMETMDEASADQVLVVEGERLVGLVTREHLRHFLRLRTGLGR